MKTFRQRSGLRIPVGLLCLVAAHCLNRAEASIVSIGNPGGFPASASLITFEGLQPFAQPTNWAGVGFKLQNGQGPDVAWDPSPVREFGPQEKTIIQNIASGFSDLHIYFPGPVSEVGFEMRTWPNENINLSLYSSGSLLESLVIPTRTTTSDSLSPLLFYGFQSSTAFDQVFIAVRGPNNNFFELDNLRFAAVPEPSAAALLLSAAAAVLWRQRRREGFRPRGGNICAETGRWLGVAFKLLL